MNVTLIYPLLSKSRSVIDENKQFWPPLGLAYIAAVLEKNGHRVQVIDRDVLLRKNKLDFDRTDDLTLNLLFSFDTDMVGISATTPNISDVIHISQKIKIDNPNLTIVLGGPHPTGEPELTLEQCSNVDIVVRGEGEFTMLDLVQGKNLKDIPGITFRSPNRITSNPDRPLCFDIDQLPLPARHLLDMDFYTRPSRFTSRNLSLRTTSVFTARGCLYRCNFCAGPLVFAGKVRFHSPKRVVREIEELINKYGVEAIYFAEDMFLSSKSRAKEILSLFEEHGLDRRIKWFAQLNINDVDEELLWLMKKAGCVGVEYGFESGSQRILDLMNKKHSVEKSLQAARITCRAKMRFQANIIVGYPGETEEDFKKTIDLLQKTKPNMIGFNIFMPLPGTVAYNQIKQEGKSLPCWDDIGNPETPQINYASMPRNRFETLYYWARFKVILPINLYNFIKDNLFNPWRILLLTATQFNGVIIKTLHSLKKFKKLKEQTGSQ